MIRFAQIPEKYIKRKNIYINHGEISDEVIAIRTIIIDDEVVEISQKKPTLVMLHGFGFSMA